MLVLKNVTVRYGQLPALRDTSLQVNQGELVCVVGPNGAGKSTLLKAIMGLLPIHKGAASLDGASIVGASTPNLICRGLSLVPEGRMIIGVLTVEDNLHLGGIAHSLTGVSQAELERVYQLFPVLKEYRHKMAGSLSGGQQQMLAIGRALLARPRLLLLDEPTLGLAPSLVKRLFETLKRLNKEGLTILLVEQNARAALALAHRACVLSAGRLVYEGDPNVLMQADRLQAAYMGRSI